jgi:hypothetical protein
MSSLLNRIVLSNVLLNFDRGVLSNVWLNFDRGILNI